MKGNGEDSRKFSGINFTVLENLYTRLKYIHRASKLNCSYLTGSIKNNLAYVAHVLQQATPRKNLVLIPGTDVAELVDKLCRACIKLARRLEMTRQELQDRAPVVFVGPGLFN